MLADLAVPSDIGAPRVGGAGLRDGGVRDGAAPAVAIINVAAAGAAAAFGPDAAETFPAAASGIWPSCATVAAPSSDPPDAAAAGPSAATFCLAMRSAGAAPDVATIDAVAGCIAAEPTAVAPGTPRVATAGVAADVSACRKPPGATPVAGADDAPASDVAIRDGLAGGKSGSSGWN